MKQLLTILGFLIVFSSLNGQCKEKKAGLELETGQELVVLIEECPRTNGKNTIKAEFLADDIEVGSINWKWYGKRNRWISDTKFVILGVTARIRLYYNPCTGAVAWKPAVQDPLTGDWIRQDHSIDLFRLNGNPSECRNREDNRKNPVYRYYNRNLGKHFWTTNPGDEVLDGYKREGIAFYSSNNGIPIYRFYNGEKHFWTANPEKEDLRGYKKEGIAFYAPRSGNKVYRFYNGKKHFWTANPEKEDLRGYKKEGIAFYCN